MVLSRLPVPSLLGLIGALLVLSPEPLLGKLIRVPHTDAGMQKALAYAVEEYNRGRDHSTNYFKQQSLIKAQYEVRKGKVLEYRLRVKLVKTTCVKDMGPLPYEKIQECKQMRGNQKPTCQFIIIPGCLPNEMNVETTICI